MSLAIDTIDTPIIFSSAITATTPPINAVDTATAVTTNYLNNIGVTLAAIEKSLTPTFSFTNKVVCATISAIFSGTLSFIGGISIGKVGGTTTFYGINPFFGDYKYWVQCQSLHRKMFGAVYTNATGIVNLFPTANTFANGTVTVFTATDNVTMGAQSSTTTGVQMRFNPGGTRTGNCIVVGGL
jgi:hypothetical protein